MASKDELNALHDKLATVLKEALDVRDEDGNLNASMLNVARQFLKDNGIEAKVVPGKPLAALGEAFPFEDSNVTPIKKAQ